MPAGPGQIIGSASTDAPYMMYVNNSGAVPMAAYSGGTVYPLTVDNTGALLTSATVSVSTGSEAFMYGTSGTGWNALLVDEDGKLETTASVTVDSVFISSGADIGSVYIKDGAYVNVIPSGTFYTNIIASGNTGVPVSGQMGRDWTLDNTTDSVSISGLSVSVDSVFIASGANIGSVHVNNLTDLGSTVVIDSPSTIGSLSVQTVNANNLDIRDLSSASDNVTVVQGTQSNLKSEVYQGTDPWIVIGSAHINNLTDLGSTVVIDAPQTIGSLAIQTVDGTVSVNVNNPETIGSLEIQTVGGTVKVVASGTEGMIVSPARGAFGYSGATFIASGTVSNIIIPGTGSKIILKGFNASAETATQFRIMFSGGNLINTFALPASGIVGMNMLGMEPSGATDEPIGIGLFNAGSLHLSVYTQDTL